MSRSCCLIEQDLRSPLQNSFRTPHSTCQYKKRGKKKNLTNFSNNSIDRTSTIFRELLTYIYYILYINTFLSNFISSTKPSHCKILYIYIVVFVLMSKTKSGRSCVQKRIEEITYVCNGATPAMMILVVVVVISENSKPVLPHLHIHIIYKLIEKDGGKSTWMN